MHFQDLEILGVKIVYYLLHEFYSSRFAPSCGHRGYKQDTGFIL